MHTLTAVGELTPRVNKPQCTVIGLICVIIASANDHENQYVCTRRNCDNFINLHCTELLGIATQLTSYAYTITVIMEMLS